MSKRVEVKQRPLGPYSPYLSSVKPPTLLEIIATKCIGACIWFVQGVTEWIRYLKNPTAYRYERVERLKEELPLPEYLSKVEEEFVTVNGLRLHCVSPGRKPDLPLLLMLHGFPECWYSWRHQMAYFRDEFDVVAVDMRGYNLSDKPEGISSYSLDLLSSDIKELVGALGHSSCTLMAHDWGGVVGWTTAALYPGAVDRLILLAAPHNGMYMVNADLDQLRRSWYILFFQGKLADRVLRSYDFKFLVDAFTPGKPSGPKTPNSLSPVDVEWYKKAFQQPGALTATVNYYRAILQCAHLERMAPVWDALKRQVVMPTLVLWGSHDAFLRKRLLKGIGQVVPQASVRVLENCSHWVQQDKVEESNKIISDWLKSNPLKED